jgi:hypothetical protein
LTAGIWGDLCGRRWRESAQVSIRQRPDKKKVVNEFWKKNFRRRNGAQCRSAKTFLNFIETKVEKRTGIVGSAPCLTQFSSRATSLGDVKNPVGHLGIGMHNWHNIPNLYVNN